VNDALKTPRLFPHGSVSIVRTRSQCAKSGPLVICLEPIEFVFEITLVQKIDVKHKVFSKNPNDPVRLELVFDGTEVAHMEKFLRGERKSALVEALRVQQSSAVIGTRDVRFGGHNKTENWNEQSCSAPGSLPWLLDSWQRLVVPTQSYS
jgi:hypothetical protein